MSTYLFTYTNGPDANAIGYGSYDKTVTGQLEIVNQSVAVDGVNAVGEILTMADGTYYKNVSSGAAQKPYYWTDSFRLADGSYLKVRGYVNYQIQTLQPVNAAGVATGGANISVLALTGTTTSRAWEIINTSGTVLSTETGTLSQVVLNHGGLSQINTDGYGGWSSQWLLTSGSLLCFVAGTLIETERGEVFVEDLKVGDLIKTKDRGFKPLLWMGTRTVSASDLDANPKFRPIRISAGALGCGLPEQDLYVSPQHRVLVKSKIAARMSGSKEVLVAAKQLLEYDGIDVVGDCNEVTYVHILFDRHEIVYSNGAETETLFTGPEALKAISDEAKGEVLALFPELADVNYEATPCRTIFSGRMSRQLAHRHMKNKTPLYTP